MAQLLSQPTSVLVQLPPRFGTGTDRGFFANGVWTPGRDASGVVNMVSWTSTPTSQWFEVAGTAMTSMDAAIQSAIPGWRDCGGGWSWMTDAWVGLASDLDNARFWIAAGGGHGASSNNGVYQFECFKMRWSVENMPSDPSAWDATYRSSASNGGTYTMYPPSANTATAQYSAGNWQPINGMFYDELPDGKPTSRHTYGRTVYVADTNELVMVCRRLWRYSLNNHRWTYKRVINDQADAPTGNKWMDDEDGIAFYDKRTGEVLSSSAGSSGIYHSIGYNLAANAWTRTWSSPWNYRSQAREAMHSSGTRMAVVVQPTKQRAQSYPPGEYWLYDIPTRTVLASSGQGGFIFAAGLSRNDFDFDDNYWESGMLVYVEPLNRYWLWARMIDQSIRQFEIDPTTSPWTLTPKTSAGNLAPLGKPPSSGNPTQYPQTKAFYVPSLNAIVMQAAGGLNFFIYRF